MWETHRLTYLGYPPSHPPVYFLAAGLENQTPPVQLSSSSLFAHLCFYFHTLDVFESTL